MKLESLFINAANSWEPGYTPNSYRAKIKYVSNSGTVEVNLTPETSQRILAVVAEEMVNASRDIAQNLTAQIIEQGALPPPVATVESMQ